MSRLFLPFNILLHMLFGEESGAYFIDTTEIKICHNKRLYRNKTFVGLAKQGKSSMGFFYGFKMTKGNVDDRVPVSDLTKNLIGFIYADKGYIKQNLFDTSQQSYEVSSRISNIRNQF